MVWGFCVYFVYMIPLETDVLRKHRFQKPADQNTLFRKYVIFEPPRVYFKPMTYICIHSTFLVANGYNG